MAINFYLVLDMNLTLFNIFLRGQKLCNYILKVCEVPNLSFVWSVRKAICGMISFLLGKFICISCKPRPTNVIVVGLRLTIGTNEGLAIPSLHNE